MLPPASARMVSVWELWLCLLVDKRERVVYDIPGSGVNREAQRQDSELLEIPALRG